MDVRRQGTTVMTALCCLIAVVFVIQLWIVSASLDALLSRSMGALLPAAIASFTLFAVNAVLLSLALRTDRRVRGNS